MSAPIPVEQSIAYAIRVKELSRMSKAQLAHLAGRYVISDMRHWSHDELVNAVLIDEFPPAVTS